MIELTAEQAAAVPQFVTWMERFRAGDPQVPPGFVVMGLAGTGKTALANALIAAAGLGPDEVAGGAMQASAASHLQKVTGWYSQTLHRWNYRVDARIGGPTVFVPNPASALRRYKLLVIDEISQVNLELWNDTLAHGVPVLVLGDPGQLRPVSGEAVIHHLRPDVELTQIHRQVDSSPIVYWSLRTREGEEIPFGDYRDSDSGDVTLRKLPAADLRPEDYLDADVILVGRNDTRQEINAQHRRRLGFRGTLPQVGERVVCRRNQTHYGLVNSFSAEVLEAGRERSRYAYTLTFKLHETGVIVPDRACAKEPLGLPVPPCPEFLRKDLSEMTFGYSRTVHSFIGQQARNVLLLDEHPLRDGRREWLYTALTRAQERVTIAVP